VTGNNTDVQFWKFYSESFILKFVMMRNLIILLQIKIRPAITGFINPGFLLTVAFYLLLLFFKLWYRLEEIRLKPGVMFPFYRLKKLLHPQALKFNRL
jgi:hypothetical protein